MHRLTWLRIFVLVGWVVIIPPIRSDITGFYVGADGRPVSVGVEDSLFQWTIYGHYQSGAECYKARDELQARSLPLDAGNANGVAWSFAKCIEDTSPLLKPDQGPIEKLPSSGQTDKSVSG